MLFSIVSLLVSVEMLLTLFTRGLLPSVVRYCAGTPFSAINQNDRNGITKIFLKVTSITHTIGPNKI